MTINTLRQNAKHRGGTLETASKGRTAGGHARFCFPQDAHDIANQRTQVWPSEEGMHDMLVRGDFHRPTKVSHGVIGAATATLARSTRPLV